MKNIQNKQPDTTPANKQNGKKNAPHDKDEQPIEQGNVRQAPGQQPDTGDGNDETQPNNITNLDHRVTNKESDHFEQDMEIARQNDPERSEPRAPLGEDPNEIAEMENLDNNEDETEQGSNKPL